MCNHRHFLEPCWTSQGQNLTFHIFQFFKLSCFKGKQNSVKLYNYKMCCLQSFKNEPVSPVCLVKPVRSYIQWLRFCFLLNQQDVELSNMKSKYSFISPVIVTFLPPFCRFVYLKCGIVYIKILNNIVNNELLLYCSVIY